MTVVVTALGPTLTFACKKKPTITLYVTPSDPTLAKLITVTLVTGRLLTCRLARNACS